MTRIHLALAALAVAALAGPAAAQSTPQALIGSLKAQCSPIIYEQDCYAEIRKATAAALAMGADEQKLIGEALIEIVAGNAGNATRIREIVSESGLVVENL